MWYNFNNTRTSKEKKHGVHQRRFPADHEGGQGSLPRLCGADADHRLPLPPAAGGDRVRPALGEHRPGVAGRRPLQVAPDALERRGREVHHGRCAVGGEVQRVRRHDGAPAQEPALRLVAPRARALFRRDGAPLVQDGREDLEEVQREAAREGLLGARAHEEVEREGGLHDGRPRRLPRAPPRHREEAVRHADPARVAQRQGVEDRGREGVERMDGRCP